MVLKIYENNNKMHPYNINDTFFVTEAYGGLMYLQWDMSTEHPLYPLLKEETRVEYENQVYLVKNINERKTTVTINCELDTTGLTKNIWTTFKRTTRSFYNICSEILADTGWTIVDAELIASRRSFDLTDVTTLDILQQCTNATSFDVTYRFDTKNKTIYIIKPKNNTDPTGVYFTDELNLSDMAFKGSSNNLITRLYVYGKDGLTISSVNAGKAYIENFTYTDRVISAVWRDERYTNVQELFDDAVVKLATMAVPERSYTCKVNDLAKQDPEKYGLLSFKLYDIVTLIDRHRKSRINHRIVEYKRYPTNANLNTVTLSTVAGTVTGKITALNNKITELNAQQLHDRTKVNEIKQDLDTTVLHISENWASSLNESMFTQTSEGLFLEVNKLVGTDRWSTLLQQSATDVQIAWNNCSHYIKFEQSKLNIYDINENILMSLNYSGQNFYYEGDYIGRLGTNSWIENDDIRGIVFDLEPNGSYMTWAARSVDDSTYIMKLTYIANSFGDFKDDDTLYAGCPLNMENYQIKNAVLNNWSFSGGSITDNFEFYAVTSFNSDGTAATWKKIQLNFNSGILKSATF